jgi:hypothetical protein
MKYILFLKHWQLLAMMFLPSILVEIFSTDILDIWHVLSSVWSFLVYIIWLYLVGITFNKAVNKTLLLFKACFFSNVFCILFLYSYNTEITAYTIWHIICISLGFLSSFYMIYFPTKCLVSYRESNGEHDVSFTGLFLCFWFFPIGVWLLQPRFNTYMHDRNTINTIGSKGSEDQV